MKNSQKHYCMLLYLLLPLSWPSKHLFSEEPHSSMRGIYHHNARPFYHTNDNWPSPAITPNIFYHSCEKENHSFIRNNLAWHHVQVFAVVLWKAAKRNLNQMQHANMTQAGILKMKINILQKYNPNLESINEFKWNHVLHGTCESLKMCVCTENDAFKVTKTCTGFKSVAHSPVVLVLL